MKGADPNKAFLTKVGEIDMTLNEQPCLCHTVKDSLVRRLAWLAIGKVINIHSTPRSQLGKKHVSLLTTFLGKH